MDHILSIVLFTPLVGGLATSFALELLVYPALYELWKGHFGARRDTLRDRERTAAAAQLDRFPLTAEAGTRAY